MIDREKLAAALYRLEWEADLYATPRGADTERYERRADRLMPFINQAQADVCVDLNERMERAVESLTDIKNSIKNSVVERARINGKIDGMKVAISYVREAWRMIP